MNLIFLSRETAGPGDGAARRRAAHHAHRMGGAALHAPRSPTRLTASAQIGPRPRRGDPQGERRLGRGHRADARAPRARRRTRAPRSAAARRQGGGVRLFHRRDLRPRARPENQRVLMLAALLPSVIARGCRGDLRQPGSAAACSTTCTAGTCSSIAAASATRHVYQFHGAVPRVPAGRRHAARLAAEERRAALDRAAGQLVARGDFDAAAALYLEAERVARARRPHAARRVASLLAEGRRKTLTRLARRDARRGPRRRAPARAGRGVRRHVRRARALQGAARARATTGFVARNDVRRAAARRRRGDRLPLLRVGGLRAARPLDRRARRGCSSGRRRSSPTADACACAARCSSRCCSASPTHPRHRDARAHGGGAARRAGHRCRCRSTIASIAASILFNY